MKLFTIYFVFAFVFACNKNAKEKEEQLDVPLVDTEVPTEKAEVAESGEAFDILEEIEAADEAAGEEPDVYVAEEEMEAEEMPETTQSKGPYEVGNSWTYKFTSNIEGNAKEQTIVRTVESIEFDVITFSDGIKWRVEDGKVYELQQTRGGDYAKSLKYFVPEKEKEEFRTFIGGDAIAMATCEKVAAPLKVLGKAYNDCVKITNSLNNTTYYSPTVGIVKIEQRNADNSGFVYVQELVKTNF